MTEESKATTTEVKKEIIPPFVAALILITICIIYTGIANDDFWDSMSDSPGYFFGLLIASIVLLLPISAVVGFVTWIIAQKVKETKFAFSPFWIGSLLALIGFLYAGKEYLEKVEDIEWERKVAASEVNRGDLSKIQLFEGTMRWGHSFGDTHTMDRVEGRIRNGLSRPIASIRIRVAILNASDEIIETFDFTQSWTQQYTYRQEPLLPGHARGFSYSRRIERLPKDLKWQWGIIGASYALD